MSSECVKVVQNGCIWDCPNVPNCPLLAQNALIPYQRTTPDCSECTRRPYATSRVPPPSNCFPLLRAERLSTRTERLLSVQKDQDIRRDCTRPRRTIGRNECLFSCAVRPFNVPNGSLMAQNAFILYRTTTPFAEAAPIHTKLPQGPHRLLA